MRLFNDDPTFAITPTHSGSRKWELTEGLVVLDGDCERHGLPTSSQYAHPSAYIHSVIYKILPLANAIIHTHAPYSLTFACANKTLKPFTQQSDVLGDVPCLTGIDMNVDKNHNLNFLYKKEEVMSSGMAGYDYSLDSVKEPEYNLFDKIKPRANEKNRRNIKC